MSNYPSQLYLISLFDANKTFLHSVIKRKFNSNDVDFVTKEENDFNIKIDYINVKEFLPGIKNDEDLEKLFFIRTRAQDGDQETIFHSNEMHLNTLKTVFNCMSSTDIYNAVKVYSFSKESNYKV